MISTGQDVLAVGADALGALWLLPALMGLHLGQLLLSSQGWRLLLPRLHRPGLLRIYRLRIAREGIDSLLPVAQVGGEVVGAQLLARSGLPLPEAAASVVVDVTIEFVTQLAFLLLGLAALAAVAPDGTGARWASAALLLAGLAGAMLAAQRFGLFRVLEALAKRIAGRWPGAGSLAGMQDAAAGMYRRHSQFGIASGLHWLAWILGTIESWAVLHALGYGISPLQALVIESLGMAARSAGFAIPGALVVQETGFALAATAAGLPEAAGLSLSLVKRVREVAVGLAGLALWWLERRRYTPT